MYNIGMVIQSMMSLTIVRLYIISRLKDGNEWRFMERPPEPLAIVEKGS
jgi:hypothetical protein